MAAAGLRLPARSLHPFPPLMATVWATARETARTMRARGVGAVVTGSVASAGGGGGLLAAQNNARSHVVRGARLSYVGWRAGPYQSQSHVFSGSADELMNP